MEIPSCCAVLACAGGSTRMGTSVSKQFLPLCGVPAVMRALRAFEEARTVSSVVVVCREQDIAEMERLLKACRIEKVTAVVPGGKTRQESVAAGVAAAPRDARVLAVHDGARPLVTPEEIDRCVLDCLETGASALGVPVKDTVKTVDGEGRVVSTLPRDRLWAAQTPQAFDGEMYRKALRRAREEGADYTDDCQLVEHLGVRVHLLMGSYANIKLTTRDDVCAAEAILRERGEGTLRIGHGYDVHRLAEGRRLILGGVLVPYEKGLLGHSDADVLTHAVMDALLGAAAMGDIGGIFPDTDPAYLDADSLSLLSKVCGMLDSAGYRIVNIDSTVIAQAPKLKPYVERMRRNIAEACGISAEQTGVKATTEEHLGFTGSGEGIAAHAVCLIERR